MSSSLWPHGLQHAGPPWPAPTPWVHSNSCPLHWWCHPASSSSVDPFSSLQSFPASGSFQMSWFCIRWSKYCSCSFSISPSNEYSGPISFRMDWTSLHSKGLSSLPQHSIITHLMYFLPLLMHLFSYKILYIFDSSFDKAYDIHTICRMFFLKS